MDYEELEEAFFSPLDAPFSPYSSGHNSVSDTSTHVQSPGAEDQFEEHLHPINEEEDDKFDQDSLDGFIDYLDVGTEIPPEFGGEIQDTAMMNRGLSSEALIPLPPQETEVYHQEYQGQLNPYAATQMIKSYNGNADLFDIRGDEPVVKREEFDTVDLFLMNGSERSGEWEQHVDDLTVIPMEEKGREDQGGYSVVIDTKFHQKYWRNDRKNLQCFPSCPEFGDYYYLRINDLKHSVSGGGTCSSAVVAFLNGDAVDSLDIVALARINLVADDGRSTEIRAGMPLSKTEFDALKKHSLLGKLYDESPTRKKLCFNATSWKLTVELSKKRRPKDSPNLAPKYSFEVICIAKNGDSYQVLGNAVSPSFHIASTRTLAREIESMQKTAATKTRKREADASETRMSPSQDALHEPEEDIPRKRVRPDEPNREAPALLTNPELIDTAPAQTKSLPALQHHRSLTNERSSEVKTPSRAQSDPPSDHSAVLVSRAPLQQKVDAREEQSEEEIDELERPVMRPSMHSSGTVLSANSSSSQARAETVETRVPVTIERVESTPMHPIIVQDFFPEGPMFSQATAYRYCVFLGLFGGHQFYLGRYGWGILYICTLGLFGLGWLHDLVTLPYLVERMNRQETMRCSLSEAYVVWLVLGIFGGHRYALGNFMWGLYDTCTLSSFGIGWLVDAVRLPKLHASSMSSSSSGTTSLDYSLLDAYLLWFPGGLVGLHHLYLRNYAKFALYLATAGLLGVGWLIDGVRLPSIVDEKNRSALYTGNNQASTSQQQEEEGIEMGAVSV